MTDIYELRKKFYINAGQKLHGTYLVPKDKWSAIATADTYQAGIKVGIEEGKRKLLTEMGNCMIACRITPAIRYIWAHCYKQTYGENK